MKQLFILMIIVLAITLLNSCSNKKADLIIPDNNCDTTSFISYNANIVPILRQNCYVCHGENSYVVNGGGNRLDSLAELKKMIFDQKLLNAINHTGGVVPMPYGGGKLSDCDIMTITAWVNRGALDN